jgi:iron complex transport system substrate-binding protein
MRRSHWLILATAVVFIAAVVLRVRSHLAAQTGPSDNAQTVASRPSVAPVPMPRDYVADPQVDPAEAGNGPRRLISLAPSITEILCALGMRDRLVGRTPYCTHPPGIESVTEVGALGTINFDKIKVLAPDLVLTTRNSGQTAEGLAKLGIPHAAVPHDTLDQVYTAITRIGELCGRPQTAAMLIASIHRDLDSLQQSVHEMHLPHDRVLVALGELPVPPAGVWVAGPGSFLDSLLTMAGQTNAVAGVLRSSHGELPLERLATLQIDTILTFGEPLTGRQQQDLYGSWAKVGPLRAIQQRRVRRVGGLEWLSAGPRIPIALHHFITALSDAAG